MPNVLSRKCIETSNNTTVIRRLHRSSHPPSQSQVKYVAACLFQSESADIDSIFFQLLGSDVPKGSDHDNSELDADGGYGSLIKGTHFIPDPSDMKVPGFRDLPWPFSGRYNRLFAPRGTVGSQMFLWIAVNTCSRNQSAKLKTTSTKSPTSTICTQTGCQFTVSILSTKA